MYLNFVKPSTKKISFLSLLYLVTISSASLAASPPKQPSSGPGGADYSHGAVASYTYSSRGILRYGLFEPDDPKPHTAPLILFIPGVIQPQANPNFYSGWVDHIVKKGNIVIFPLYRTTISTISSQHTRDIIFTTQAAIKLLQTGNHVRPDLDKFAILGQSCGGVSTANVAALAEEFDLPIPRAIMPITPSLVFSGQSQEAFEDFSKIPDDTLLLVVTGDLDYIAGQSTAKTIFYSTPQIPLENKDFITLVSDHHGVPSLVAGHFAACSISSNEGNDSLTVDALDYYGFFKLFDGLIDAAFYGRNREYALGNTPQQRYMGKWSDGVAVKELIVTDNP